MVSYPRATVRCDGDFVMWGADANSSAASSDQEAESVDECRESVDECGSPPSPLFPIPPLPSLLGSAGNLILSGRAHQRRPAPDPHERSGVPSSPDHPSAQVAHSALTECAQLAPCALGWLS